MLSKETVSYCRNRLVELRAEIINLSNRIKNDYQKEDHGKEDADLTMAILAEKAFATRQKRLRKKLEDIESALAKIHHGTYGLCEETEEVIAEKRLKTIPWTRLSLEGAEIREQFGKKRRA